MDSFSMQTVKDEVEKIYQRILFAEKTIPVLKQRNFLSTKDLNIARMHCLQFNIDHQQQIFSRLGYVIESHIKRIEHYDVAIKDIKEITSQLNVKFKEDMRNLSDILSSTREYNMQRNLQCEAQRLEKFIEESSLRVSHPAATQSEEPEENEDFLRRMETQQMEARLLKENRAVQNAMDLGSTEEELHHVVRMDQQVLQTSV
ncbi:uncharacterized protein LOC133349805 isoform X2 [Lethenteron reissneri]|uniref:uncharacterized protein LOC133349805 isoform X2 n=1 Tax=Lethenteron reissneri TaxID=7753 RepID=UPI002AB6137B|nr:uncharacterized protein LOC133349805 isoform X2 [Lethenteron reissneri]